MTELPKLPGAQCRTITGINQEVEYLKYYSEGQMLQFQRDTIEACAEFCEDEAWRLKGVALQINSRTTNIAAIQASKCADAIRSMK